MARIAARLQVQHRRAARSRRSSPVRARRGRRPRCFPEQQRLPGDRRVDRRHGVVDQLHHLAVARAGRRARPARPSPRTAGLARSKSASSPPAMIVSVPSSAFGEEPVTGASMKRDAALARARRRSRRAAAARSWTCRRTAAPLDARSPTPSAPSSTDSTWAPSTTIVMTTSLAAGQRRGRVRDRRPVRLRPLSACRAVRFQTVSSKPARRRLAAIREPMIPSPMNPTRRATPRSGPIAGHPSRRLPSRLGVEPLPAHSLDLIGKPTADGRDGVRRRRASRTLRPPRSSPRGSPPRPASGSRSRAASRWHAWRAARGAGSATGRASPPCSRRSRSWGRPVRRSPDPGADGAPAGTARGAGPLVCCAGARVRSDPARADRGLRGVLRARAGGGLDAYTDSYDSIAGWMPLLPEGHEARADRHRRQPAGMGGVRQHGAGARLPARSARVAAADRIALAPRARIPEPVDDARRRFDPRAIVAGGGDRVRPAACEHRMAAAGRGLGVARAGVVDRARRPRRRAGRRGHRRRPRGGVFVFALIGGAGARRRAPARARERACWCSSRPGCARPPARTGLREVSRRRCGGFGGCPRCREASLGAGRARRRAASSARRRARSSTRYAACRSGRCRCSTRCSAGWQPSRRASAPCRPPRLRRLVRLRMARSMRVLVLLALAPARRC